MKYKTADFFMVRTPTLSANKYKQLFCSGLTRESIEEKLIEVCSKNTVREALKVSSVSLEQALNKVKNRKDYSKREQVINSLLKYFIRMTTRTTPYGLFSGVTLGLFDEKTEGKLKNICSHVKRARVDMEWLYRIMRKIENDEDILKSLNIVRNELSLVNGCRLDIAYISNYGQTSKNSMENNIEASIRYSKVVKFVMETCKQPIKYGELEKLLKRKNPNIKEEKIKTFLNQLLKNEYIITELRPPLNNTNTFEYILSKIEGIHEAKDIYLKLMYIKSLIDEYNKISIGEGVNLYNIIINYMKELTECKNYLQVDLRIKEENFTLNHKVAEEIEKVVEVLLRLSSETRETYSLIKYREEFMEKYGTDREVPVIELLDEDKGLGAPAGYMTPRSSKIINDVKESDEDYELSKCIIDKLVQAFINKKDEVVISDEDIKSLEKKNLDKFNINELPLSLEIGALVTAKSKEEIDKGKFKIFIAPNPGSNHAGKTFGRFIDILPKKICKKILEINRNEKEIMGEDTIFAEISELPQSGRLSNVALNWNARDYEIVLATNHSGKKKNISVADLYIGVDRRNDKFYIKSKSLNKRVIITTGHMLNILYGSNIYRFLREVSNSSVRDVMKIFFTTGISTFHYNPRIRYGKVILVPASWKLSNEILGIDVKNMTKEEFYEAVNLWRETWRVPQFVYQKDADNRLLLNLESHIHLDQLFYMIKRENRELVITELEEDFENLWVEGEDGKYFCELVVPVLIDKEEVIKNHRLLEDHNKKSINYLSTLDSKRTLFPGDDWLYLKLYGNSKRVEEFIGYEILPFCSELLKDGHIEKYFFIRYADPDSHIRLRIKGVKERIFTVLMYKLNLWFKRLKDEGLLTRVCIDTYSREIERYGGVELIEYFEDVFYADSIFVSNIINLKRSGELNLNLEFIAVASIINIMEEMHIEYETQRMIFMERFDREKFREDFKKERKIYSKVGNSDNDWESLKDVEGGEILYHLFLIRRESLKNYALMINKLDEEDKLWTSKLNILFSIIHMNCNRLLGSVQVEMKVMALVRHTLQSIEYVKKHSINKL